MAASGITLKIFSYETVRSENQTHYLPNVERMRYVFVAFIV